MARGLLLVIASFPTQFSRGSFMKRILFFCALILGLVAAPSARANTYSLSFTGCLGPYVVVCLGTPVTTGTVSPGVTDITFTTNGAPGFLSPVDITGISGTVVIGQDTYTIGNLATGLGGDNELTSFIFGPTLDSSGVDFLLSGKTGPASTDTYTEFNITYDS